MLKDYIKNYKLERENIELKIKIIELRQENIELKYSQIHTPPEEDRIFVYGLNKKVGTFYDRERIAKKYNLSLIHLCKGKYINIDNTCKKWFITCYQKRYLIDIEAYAN